MVTRSAVGTRERILAAAAVLFRERGLSGASVRDIAAAAEADPALVIRHFGSKEALFLEAMRMLPADDALFGGPVEQMGRRCIRFLLEFDVETRGTFLALLRGSAEPAIADRLQQAHLALFVAPLRGHLTGADAELRARLAAALVGGLLYGLWVVGDEALLAADQDDVVERYGALLQQLITPGR